jgi:hypothetical protein
MRDYLSKLDIIFEGGSPAKRSRKTNFEKNFNFWRDLECSENENIHIKSKSVLPANQPPLSLSSVAERLDICLDDTTEQAVENH